MNGSLQPTVAAIAYSDRLNVAARKRETDVQMLMLSSLSFPWLGQNPQPREWYRPQWVCPPPLKLTQSR